MTKAIARQHFKTIIVNGFYHWGFLPMRINRFFGFVAGFFLIALLANGAFSMSQRIVMQTVPSSHETGLAVTPVDAPVENPAAQVSRVTSSPAATSSGSTAENAAAAMEADIIRVAPGKSEIVRLDRDAASIIVGSPSHARVLLDSPRTLIIVPGMPGATSFQVLDADGAVVLEKYVIVAAPQQRYMRIRRLCGDGNTGNCAESATYYCPDGCYEVRSPSEQEATSPSRPPASGNNTPLMASDLNNPPNAPGAPDVAVPMPDNTNSEAVLGESAMDDVPEDSNEGME